MKFEWMGYYWIVTSDRIVRSLGRLISLGNQAMGLTFYPFIFVRTDTRHHTELIRHETIHIRQQLELLLVGAWVLFLIEYWYARYIKKLDARQAYYYTALEQEAHRNADNPNYLKERKPYAMLRYIRDKKWLARDQEDNLIVKEF